MNRRAAAGLMLILGACAPLQQHNMQYGTIGTEVMNKGVSTDRLHAVRTEREGIEILTELAGISETEDAYIYIPARSLWLDVHTGIKGAQGISIDHLLLNMIVREDDVRSFHTHITQAYETEASNASEFIASADKNNLSAEIRAISDPILRELLRATPSPNDFYTQFRWQHISQSEGRSFEGYVVSQRGHTRYIIDPTTCPSKERWCAIMKQKSLSDDILSGAAFIFREWYRNRLQVILRDYLDSESHRALTTDSLIREGVARLSGEGILLSYVPAP